MAFTPAKRWRKQRLIQARDLGFQKSPPKEYFLRGLQMIRLLGLLPRFLLLLESYFDFDFDFDSDFDSDFDFDSRLKLPALAKAEVEVDFYLQSP